MADRRFPTSFKDVPDADDPGLVLGDDNVVYLIKPDGSRVAIGSGGAPTTVSHTYTLDRAGGFVSSHTFDLGLDAAIPVFVTLTLLSFAGDGETLGNDPGTLYIGSGGDPMVKTNSDDAADFAQVSPLLSVNHFVPAAVGFIFELQGDGATPQAVATVARYLQINPQLVSNDTGATYAGGNNPVASVQIDVTYR